MCGFTCCVEIDATVTGRTNSLESDIKRYIMNMYQVENLNITDVIYHKKNDMTHFIITYNTYYEEDVTYCYYDFVSDRKHELETELHEKFILLDVNVEDINVSVF